MNELIQKFNLYDHLAYILVGFYQICILWILNILTTNNKTENLTAFLKIDFTIIFMLISYLIGHLVQAVSNIFEKWEKNKKDEKTKDLNFIIKKAKKYFKLPQKISDKVIWQYCYLYSLSNDFSGHITLFNSMHSLYRGFWIASLVGSIISIFVLTFELIIFFVNKCKIIPDYRLLIFTLSLFILCVLFNRRKKRFFNYLGEKTLISFDIISKNIIKQK